jgi:drug/metabolite transporter (DMT)-like permease
MLTVSVLSFIPGVLFENLYSVFNISSTIGLIFTALFCSSLAYSVQMTMQKYTSPIHAALIFMGEPVFSMFFAYILGGETLAPQGIVGCVLVLCGMALSEIRIRSKTPETYL